MDYPAYLIKVSIAALTKIGPIAGFIVMAWIFFIKLPFLLFRKSLSMGKQFEVDVTSKPTAPEFKSGYNVSDYNNFLKRQSRLEEPKQEKKKEEPKQEKKEERRKEQRKEAPPREEKTGISPEENLFNLKAGQRYTKDEIKKRYHDLLKQSHPDKVASMGPDFKKMAELKTQEINSAYEKLKSRAA